MQAVCTVDTEHIPARPSLHLGRFSALFCRRSLKVWRYNTFSWSAITVCMELLLSCTDRGMFGCTICEERHWMVTLQGAWRSPMF